MTLNSANNEVLVSTYLLTYNHEKYVAQALESMLNQQTNFKYEILVGDDCSTDRTPSILKEYKEKYPDKIKVFFRSHNLGATKNLYLLQKECKGKYIAPLEGDDYWVGEERLQYLVDFLEKNPIYVGISHRRERHDVNGSLLGYDPSNDVINKSFYIEDFLKGKRYSSACMVYRNLYLDSGNKYADLLQASRNVGDFQSAMIILDMGPVYISDKILGVYRVRNGPNESNYNSITNHLDNYFDHIKIIRAVEEFFPKYNLGDEKYKRQSDVLLYCIKRFKIKGIRHVVSTISHKEWLVLLSRLPWLACERVIVHFKKTRKKVKQNG